MGGQRNNVEDQQKQGGWSKKTRSGGQKKTRWEVKKNEGRSEKNKVGGLKNKGPVYFDKISCTCAAQHYLYNNRAKLLVSTVFSEHATKRKLYLDKTLDKLGHLDT